MFDDTQPEGDLIMTVTDDSAYLYARAEVELDMAQRAAHPAAVSAHYQLANAYLDRIHGTAMGREPMQALG